MTIRGSMSGMSAEEKTTHMLEAIVGMEWERAKGALRSVVAVQGRLTPSETGRRYREGGVPAPWQVLSRMVEEFINEVEDKGLHE